MTQISDHALVRWLERVRGIPMEDLRAELARIVEPYAKLKVAQAEIGGFWFIFREGKLVTIAPEKPKPYAAHRHDREHHNGTHIRNTPMPWQGKQRRRDHR